MHEGSSQFLRHRLYIFPPSIRKGYQFPVKIEKHSARRLETFQLLWALISLRVEGRRNRENIFAFSN